MSGKNEIWNPISVTEVQDIFKKIPINWWIAGGWALDLYSGRTTREHGDIDIVILRSEHLTLQKYLYEGWELFKATKGELIPWHSGEILIQQYDNIWVRKKGGSTWTFQVMILDTEDEYWIYKRKNSIRREIKDIGLISFDGIPYLKPEIQLLYKGGSSVIREKDFFDLKNVLPHLSISGLKWLRDSLAKQFPQGHLWIDFINEYYF